MKYPTAPTLAGTLAAIVVFAALIATPFDSQARPKSSGLSGQVLLHNSLVANLGRPKASISPFRASFRVYSAATGAFIVAVTTDSLGRFEALLPPGNYRLVPDTMFNGQVLEQGEIVIGRYEEAAPVDVTIHPHRRTKLVITYEERMGN
jgi:hypothetical protein